ncbi:MAG: TonB-dependent receptor [Flavobacteriales bacterium]|nr:TonB-dependent receptor [Flavobacteriales bacterium]HQV53335.1 TonB-dependent receptor [Flavobacteriales bacterium]HQX31602.1 TonB-dependent receptor [Flavobacteriales bacterium]HQX36771.1 TonB-dependent receptor [Flavobacteriales bacterium]HQZ94573.1 TonB-dependent receptor [Flavobacteriales bacterium]
MTTRTLNYVFSFLLILIGSSVAAQNGTVRGFIYEEGTGEPMIFTPIFLEGAQMGGQTDVNGYYSINKIPAGNYTLMVAYLGYDTLRKKIEVVADKIINEKLFVRKGSTLIREFEVSADKQEAQNTVRMGITKLTPKQITLLPAVGGDADLAQYLQVVPGVIFTGDQGGQLYVRGGSPIMNKMMLDGMVLYNPFHSIGLFSVFDNDIIRNADIYTAGFNAEHGGRISSIMDITTRDGNKTRMSGKVSASTFAAKALLEGPLKKQTSTSEGSSSYLLNFRHSYLDRTSKELYSFVDTAGLPFKFTDIYGKVSFNGSTGSKFNLFGFNFTDGVKYKNVSDLNWNNWGAGTNFVLIPSGSAVLIDGVFSVSNYKIKMVEGALDPRTSEIASFNGGLNFKLFNGEDEARYGIEVLGFRTNFQFFNSVGRKFVQEQNTSEIAGYFNYRKNFNKLILDPGLRLHYYASLSVANIEPRMGLKWNITDDLRFKAAAGRYSQNLVAANSDRDVVNLFYGFLSSPDDLPETLTTEDGTVRKIKDPLQRANHYVAGFEYDLTNELTANFEVYLKDFRQVTNLNRNKLFNDTPEFADEPDELKNDYIVETGKAYGADLQMKYEKGQTFVWFVYSYTYVDRFDGIQTYNPVWDRRHNLNAVISQSFGKFDSWKVNIRWNYGSGFPYTQTQGFYGGVPFDGDINTNVTTSNASLQTIFGPINNGRLPDYHRLDIGITKDWRFDENKTLQLDLSLTNTYDRENIFYFDRVRYERVNQLPFLPSAGISFKF